MPSGPPGMYMPKPKFKMPKWLIAIVAIAVVLVLVYLLDPSFFGTNSPTANALSDRQAQSNLNTLLTAVEAEYPSSQSYSGVNAAGFAATLPQITVVSGSTSSTGEADISMAVSSQWVALAAQGNTGHCFYAVSVGGQASNLPTGVPDSPGTYFAVNDQSDCTAKALPTTGWQANTFPGS